jgi:sugar lactone lactonase YvrE
LNNPVQLQATPVAGFSPLPVAFQIQASLPGTVQQVACDFNGDDIADFLTNSLDSITNTYTTNGEYFPVVTIQTTAGRFSSMGGWNAVALDATNVPIRINVQVSPTVATFANITDPVDLKWDGTNLYVLSRSTATLTEFGTSGNTLRSLSGLGTNPTGLDVDAAGNVYVAMNGANQVWRFHPTNTTFAADPGFGTNGYIGNGDASSGTGTNQFNAPFDVAVSADGTQIAVSDSGNNRIQMFDTTGHFINSFGSQGTAAGQLNSPKGLAYDSVSTLYVEDSANNRIVVARGDQVLGVSGTNGAVLGQFNTPVNISVGERGVYVADTGNNRIQSFDLVGNGVYTFAPAAVRFAVVTNFNGPYAVAAVNNLTNELFYVADTGNNRVALCMAPNQDATALQALWNHMTGRVAAGDIPGAISDFSISSADDYRQTFLNIGTSGVVSDINQVGALTPVFVNSDTAEYYFNQVIDGQTITFPVDFTKENGVWKIQEF